MLKNHQSSPPSFGGYATVRTLPSKGPVRALPHASALCELHGQTAQSYATAQDGKVMAHGTVKTTNTAKMDTLKEQINKLQAEIEENRGLLNQRDEEGL